MAVGVTVTLLLVTPLTAVHVPPVTLSLDSKVYPTTVDSHEIVTPPLTAVAIARLGAVWAGGGVRGVAKSTHAK